MERLLLFVYQNRAFFSFLALEIFCAWLIVQNNQYQGTKFFNSSNGLVATMNNFSQGVRDYFQLSEVNRMLAEENAALKKQLGRPGHPVVYPLDSMTIRDSVMVKQYDFISAKVVNNHVDFFKNYITIDKGRQLGGYRVAGRGHINRSPGRTSRRGAGRSSLHSRTSWARRDA